VGGGETTSHEDYGGMGCKQIQSEMGLLAGGGSKIQFADRLGMTDKKSHCCELDEASQNRSQKTYNSSEIHEGTAQGWQQRR